ncbi:MAG: fibronectin type III domain-containing protein, partial [Dehalococcoidales bacterium]
HTVYAASNNPGSGIYRFIIGSSTQWERIDSTLPAGAIIKQLALAANGALYAANEAPNGGMERCINPKPTSGVTFETVTRGLSASATLSGLWQRNGQLWSIDSHNITNINLLTYNDTLVLPAEQTSPEDETSGIGILVNHTVRNVTLDWETLEGATSYEWQCNYVTDFSTVPADLSGITTSSSIRLPALEPATTYYWRVRAHAPVLSPWSSKRSFTTSMDTEEVSLKPEIPLPGALDVSIKPIFQWTAVLGAEAYELLVATDAEFNHPVVVKINEYALKTNAWNCDVSLEYHTVYYWKIRATTASTCSAWSSVGIFTTEFVQRENNNASFAPPTTTQLLTQELLAAISTPTISPSTSPPFPLSAPTSSTAASHLLDIPAWMIYFIGGLFGIIFLALLIVLVVVIKIKRL